ncbi:MAG: hypothetical protein ACI9BN_001426, partial [Francisella sp.]
YNRRLTKTYFINYFDSEYPNSSKFCIQYTI